MPIVFSLHYRTHDAARDAGMKDLLERAWAIRSLDYLDFLSLQMHAAVVLINSGGVHLETMALGVSCFTFRENTERPVTIRWSTNRIIGNDSAYILLEIERALRDPPSPKEGAAIVGRAG